MILFALITVGALYSVTLGATVNSADFGLSQQINSGTLLEPEIVVSRLEKVVTIEDISQELVSVQQEQEIPLEEPYRREPEVKEGLNGVSVPFYSQFNDISDPAWKKIGCGIASLAMIIGYYESAVSVDVLLAEGIASNAYLTDAGWIHAGLIRVAEKYGLSGKSVVMSDTSIDDAYEVLEKTLKDGPVMASVYYTFTPGHPIPHLVVVNSIEDGVVYYNDPAEPKGGGTISVERFKSAWKKRYIVFRPATS